MRKIDTRRMNSIDPYCLRIHDCGLLDQTNGWSEGGKTGRRWDRRWACQLLLCNDARARMAGAAWCKVPRAVVLDTGIGQAGPSIRIA